MDYSYYYDAARHALDWSASVLSEENLAWLRSLPYTYRIGEVGFCHGSPIDPKAYEYIFALEQARELMPYVAELPEVTFIGHSHLCKAFAIGNGEVNDVVAQKFGIRRGYKYIISVGSVGQPRDYDNRACFVICDTDARTVEYTRVEYDIETCGAEDLRRGAGAELRQAAVPGRLSACLDGPCAGRGPLKCGEAAEPWHTPCAIQPDVLSRPLWALSPPSSLALAPARTESRPPSRVRAGPPSVQQALRAEAGRRVPDPAMDEIEALLEQVPADSMDAPSARSCSSASGRAGRSRRRRRRSRQRHRQRRKTACTSPPASAPERAPSRAARPAAGAEGRGADAGPGGGMAGVRVRPAIRGCFQPSEPSWWCKGRGAGRLGDGRPGSVPASDAGVRRAQCPR